MRKKLCSVCKKERFGEDRYCQPCKNAYMRNWRVTHPLSESQRLKSIARRKTNMRVQRGLIIRQPCERCDSKNAQAHHENYNKPYEIMWFCKVCHKEWHQFKDG